MHNAVMYTLSLYDVIGISGHLHIIFKSFSNIAQPLHKGAVRGCSFLYIIAEKSVITSEAFLVDDSIQIEKIKFALKTIAIYHLRLLLLLLRFTQTRSVNNTLTVLP